MRLECQQCVVRDWSPLDRDALVRAADDRRIWRNHTHAFPYPYSRASVVKDGEIIDRVIYALVDVGDG